MPSDADALAAVSPQPRSSAPASAPSPRARASNTSSPSHVSTSAMPAAKSAGSSITRTGGTSLRAASANNPTSDAVSKPSPKRKPTGYIFHALSTRPSTYRQQAQPTRQPAASTRTASPSSSSDAAWAGDHG